MATCILIASSITMLFPGTIIDKIWIVNERSYAELIRYHQLIGPGFLTLGIVFALTVIGWFKRQKWAWWLTLFIFIANGMGDVAQLAYGNLAGGIIGVSVAGLLLFYLTRNGVRTYFQK